MEGQIEARIWIKNIKGADILCLKSFDALNQILPELFNDGSIAIVKGTKLDIDGDSYIIREIKTILYSQTFDDDGQYGYNIYGAGVSTYPYNFEIYYYVEKV